MREAVWSQGPSSGLSKRILGGRTSDSFYRGHGRPREPGALLQAAYLILGEPGSPGRHDLGPGQS